MGPVAWLAKTFNEGIVAGVLDNAFVNGGVVAGMLNNAFVSLHGESAKVLFLCEISEEIPRMCNGGIVVFGALSMFQ
jgi:hypothetical protein